MELLKKDKTLKLDVLLILALFVVARISCQALSNLPFFNMTFTFIYGAAFVFLFFFTVRRLKKQDFYLMVAVFLYAGYVFVRSYWAGSSIFARDSFNAYVIVFLTMIYVWIKEKPLATRALMFKLIFAALIFDYVYSIWVLWQDPNASRISAATSVLEKSSADIWYAVGGFDTVYGGLSVVVILLCMRRIFKEKHINNLSSILVLFLALVFIIMASYATAILLLILTLALLWGEKNKAASAMVVICILLIFIFHEPIGDWIMDKAQLITYSETASEKAYDFGYMLKTFEVAGTYAGESGRASKMISSLETFERYPIFGGIGMPDCTVYGHSELVDFPGNFGLVGFGFLIAYFVCLYKNVKACLQSKVMKSGWKIIMLVFVISAALNPTLYSMQMMPLILMVPLAPSYIEMCETKKKLGEKQ